MMSSTFRRGVLALGVAGTVAFGGGVAFADIQKCQAGLEKAQTGFQSALSKALVKCADGIRKEILKGLTGKLGTAAATCDKGLGGVYAATKAVDKYIAAVEKLAAAPATCSPDDLTSLGHLLSGGGSSSLAPPTTGTATAYIKFTEDSILLKAETDALNSEMSSTPDFWNTLQQAQLAAGCIDTSTGWPVSTPPLKYLCGLKQECYERTCKIDEANSGAKLLSSGLQPVEPAISLSLRGADNFNICNVKGLLSGTLEPGFLYISGNPGHATLPVNVMSGAAIVCIDSVRNEGWCDCTSSGGGVQLNTDMCQDRLIQAAEVTAGVDSCNSKTSLASNDANFPGSKNGFIKMSAGGTSTRGDCLNMMTTQFTILQSSPLSLDRNGHPDCTSGNLPAPNAPAPVPLTTGTAVAHLDDAVSNGTCADYTFCVEDADCVTGQTPCTASFVGELPNHTLTTNSGVPYQGAKAAGGCDALEQGNLSGLKLVGAFPGPGKGTMGDSVTAFKIQCQ